MSAATIPIAQIRQLIEAGQRLNIFDVRTPAEFGQLHVKGARSMPLDGLDPAAIAASRSSANESIYVICQSGARAGRAQQQLSSAGVENVFSIEGGTAEWDRSGLPIERGTSRVISLERQVRIGAGSLVVIGVILGSTVNRWFFAVPAFVGSGLVFAGITDYCGMALLLVRMPWNR